MDSGSRRERHSARWWRLNAGHSLDSLAALSGVSRPTLARMEQGIKTRDLTCEERVCRALGIPERLYVVAEPWERPTLSLLDQRERAELRPSTVAQLARVPARVLERAEEGRPIALHYAKSLADFYAIRVTDFYPVSEAA
jgi:transcriptional regulator with XRE-family HTH domain